ncbi:hypothetical protein [Streptomyces sp. NPDC058657]|uniref:hypothetical protein n=1 Tax=unclassified Streptomyces TaxID=2593676 RepID=UPI00364A4A52
MSKIRNMLLAGALALPLLAVPAALTTASAAPADTTGVSADGNYWVWEETNFGGTSCGWAGNDSDWRSACAGGRFNMSDRASAWQNSGYGGALGDVRVYENIGWTGASTCAPNGGRGNIPWEWNDRISSHKWVTNCGW